MLMSAAGKGREARDLAESVAPLFASRPPREGLLFFAALGMARRQADDSPAAAIAYEVATMIASAAKESSEMVGVVYDNLATIRREQQQFEAATSASDLALEILRSLAPSGRAYGVALSNRALVLDAQGQAIDALDHSERALVILREVFQGDPGPLSPFLEDNRQLRQKVGGP